MNRIFRILLMVSVAAGTASSQNNQPSSSESNRAESKAQSSPRRVDHAAAYYHYTLAHMYEEMVTAYGRSDLAAKATEEYRLPIAADPSSDILTLALVAVLGK